MKPVVRTFAGVLILCIAFGAAQFAVADDASPAAAGAAVQTQPGTVAQTPAATPPAAAQPMPAPAQPQKYPPFADVVKEMTAKDGFIKTYHKGNRLLAELTPAHLDRDLIVLISIARGIGEGSVLGGMSWGFGDDWIWQFKKVDERIHVVRKNVRFTAAKGSPEDKAVNLAYTDSILFSLPIATMSPSGAFVVDLTPVFMQDLPQIGRVLPGFSFSPDRSTWSSVKGFADNIELEVAATYASGGIRELDTVADPRGTTINIHYSISALPQTGYQPRTADDRIGHFITVVKDYSRKGSEDRFVRYINRWDLKKLDPSAEKSPPQKPIRFWLEKTIPFAYRKPIRDGILEWNKAFEKAGYYDAIEVQQQPDNADWDPEDVRYNTFRWITASAGFAMGPSRVNPNTGQILDADIIFDADFLQFWKQEYETFTPESIAALTGGPLDIKSYQEEQTRLLGLGIGHQAHCNCQLHNGMSRELAFGASVMAARTTNPAELEKLIVQGLKEVTMHEVGHTLGLRHNFKSSTVYTLDEVNDQQKTNQTGLTASVMDYSPANLMPAAATQGDYYSQTIGPYDMWAIEYAYKPLGGGTDGEVAELKKIAARSADPMLAYSTDEDTRGIDPDPLSNRFDLGKDSITYAKSRAQLIAELWPKVIDEVTKEGDGYEKARRAFGVLLGNYGRAMHFASRYVGGLYVNRHHKGDPNAQAPFVVVEPAKQREALALMEEQVFSDKPFQFPPDFYNKLASTRWDHWGSPAPLRSEYAVHDVIAQWQNRILSQLLSSLTLDRLHDSELKVAADQDALTTPELFERLSKAIFAEVEKMPAGDFTNRKPYISSLRRNLQRSYVQRLSLVAMSSSEAPPDTQTVAAAELTSLEGRITAVLKTDPKIDSYSKAHLSETASKIRKVLDARYQLARP